MSSRSCERISSQPVDAVAAYEREFLVDRLNYRLTPEDIALHVAVLADHQSDQLVKLPPTLICVPDSQCIWVFGEAAAGFEFSQGAITEQHGGIVVAQLPHNESSKGLWLNRIMSDKRMQPGGTAWTDVGKPGGVVWNALENAEGYAVENPNTSAVQRNSQVIIPHIIVPPSGVLKKVPGVPDTYLYMRKWYLHEHIHVADMTNLSWVSKDEAGDLQESERIACTPQDLIQLIELIDFHSKIPMPEAVQTGLVFLQTAGVDQQYYLRSFLGESLAFVGEMHHVMQELRAPRRYGSHTSTIIEAFSRFDQFEHYVAASRGAAASLSLRGDEPVHKNVFGFELALWLARVVALQICTNEIAMISSYSEGIHESTRIVPDHVIHELDSEIVIQHFNRESVVRVLMLLRTLMLGRVPHADIFFDDDVAQALAVPLHGGVRYRNSRLASIPILAPLFTHLGE